MKIITAKFILSCNENFEVLKNHAIKFEKNIVKILPISNLNESEREKLVDYGDSVIMPAFVNTHTHLEYSANVASLHYGDFLVWVKSVITNRDTLSADDKKSAMKKALASMIKSGVGTIGEISSFGADFDLFEGFDARVVFFNEILGSNPAVLEKNMGFFKERLAKAKNMSSELFIPAISIHSPYSTHPDLAKAAITIAKDENMCVSAHFLESEHEKKWLENGEGEFKEWLGSFSKNAKPMYSPKSFVEMFEGVRTLFTHCVWADEYFDIFDANLHSLTHCPRSNKLLSRRTLNIQKARKKMSINIGTDGLSSNYSLNFWDELRAGLFVHESKDLCEFSKDLLRFATIGGAKALGLDCGALNEGKSADIAVFDGFGDIEENQLALQLILHTNEAKALFINGKEVQI